MPEQISSPHDRFFKEIWSRKEIARDFLRYYVPGEIVELLDLNSLRLDKESFVDADLRTHYSDLLYTLKLKDGGPAWVYILFEHKRSPERSTAFQLLRYIVRVWERVSQDQSRTEMSPVLPILIYHGDSAWPYGETLQQSMSVAAPLAAYTPDFRFMLCDLSGLAEAEIRGAVLLRVAMLLMKHISDPRLGERLPAIFELLRALGKKRTVLEHLETLLRYLALAADSLTENDVRRAVGSALPQMEETLMSTLAQQWLEQGRQEGRLQGRQEGLQMGEATLLIRQLERRFGPLPEPYLERIEAADGETLLEWGDRVLSAGRLEEVFLDSE